MLFVPKALNKDLLNLIATICRMRSNDLVNWDDDIINVDPVLVLTEEDIRFMNNSDVKDILRFCEFDENEEYFNLIGVREDVIVTFQLKDMTLQSLFDMVGYTGNCECTCEEETNER